MITKMIDGYEVIRSLGQGTFGHTLLVKKDGVEFALKLFKNEMIRSKNDVTRIGREIEALKRVNHPSVVKYVADGVYSEGFDNFRYLVMEYVDGEPLRNFIERNGRLTVQQTQKIANQLLDGLQAIHEAGLLHRDLKPDNIYITRLGEVRILDFGLVKLLDASTLTATGTAMGTYAYMAPEQLQDSKHVDFRADLYSIGAIIFHMVTGRIPLEIHSLVEAPYKIINEIPPFASSINPAIPNKLDNIIAILLEKQLHRRIYTIQTLKMEMQSFIDKSIPGTRSDLRLRFLPRLLHNERGLVEDFNEKYGVDGIVFPANFFPKYRAVFDSVRDSKAFTVIDPVIYRLAYSKFTNTQSLTNLPYVVSALSKERPEDFIGIAACQKRAKEVIDWQLAQNPSILVAPFHYVLNTDDPWLNVDLKIFNECRKYMNDIGEKRPLYAGISCQIESLTDNASPNVLVNYYTRIQAEGYILMFDAKLDSFNPSHYYAFGRIVSMLGELLKPIILSRVNDFGLGLTAFGATAISSGIGFIEDFRESILIEDGMNYSLKPRYYIPKLLTSYTEKALKDIFEPAVGRSLACQCPYCKGSTDIAYLLKPNIVKGHYLWQKKHQLALLNEMAKPERLRWFLDSVKEADILLRDIKKATKSKVLSGEHFKFWIESIQQLERNMVEAMPQRSVAP